MDERLKKALDFSNYMVTLNNQKRVLKEKFLESRIYYFNGGQFSVTQELLTFVKILCDNDDSNVVIVDDNDTPIRIEQLHEFYENISDVYFTSTNEYETEYQKLRAKRKVSGLVDYDKED
tara:strand:- start:313 stop:672 length:360 start_codon:yes stop_codon:yes gene_type:complete